MVELIFPVRSLQINRPTSFATYIVASASRVVIRRRNKLGMASPIDRTKPALWMFPKLENSKLLSHKAFTSHTQGPHNPPAIAIIHGPGDVVPLLSPAFNKVKHLLRREQTTNALRSSIWPSQTMHIFQGSPAGISWSPVAYWRASPS